MSYRSGPALDVTAGISTGTRTGPPGYGDPNLVSANLVGQIQIFDPHVAQRASNGRVGNFYVEPAAFERNSLVALQNNTSPALSTYYGTLGRNAFRGPDRTNVNLTFGQVTDLYGERAKFEIRAEWNKSQHHHDQRHVRGRFRRRAIRASSNSPGGLLCSSGEAKENPIVLRHRLEIPFVTVVISSGGSANSSRE